MPVRSLVREDPLEEEMATHCSILAWRVPWTEEPDGLQSTGSQRVGLSRAAEHALLCPVLLAVFALSSLKLRLCSHGSSVNPSDSGLVWGNVACVSILQKRGLFRTSQSQL